MDHETLVLVFDLIGVAATVLACGALILEAMYALDKHFFGDDAP